MKKQAPSFKSKDQTSRFAIVTGANVGLGFETARALTDLGIHVIFGCRNEERATEAQRRILIGNPNAEMSFVKLDLTDSSSIKTFADEVNRNYDRMDLLINNAGVMMPPYSETKDGFETTMGANYFGHFLLTGLLLPLLEKTSGSRIVTLSSLAHAWGDIYFDDINFKKNYDARKAYGQSKLACLMFSYELQRQLDSQGFQTCSVAAHPGVTLTNIGRHLPSAALALGKLVSPFLFQTPKKAVEPILIAALDPNVKGGEYYGPGGFRQFKGPAKKVGSNRNSRDKDKAERLWLLSEELTGFQYFK